MNISEKAKSLLSQALAHPLKQMNNIKLLDGTKHIVIGGQSVSDGSYEDYAIWLSALIELEENGFVEDVNDRTIFSVTAKGAAYK